MKTLPCLDYSWCSNLSELTFLKLPMVEMAWSVFPLILIMNFKKICTSNPCLGERFGINCPSAFFKILNFKSRG